MKVKKHYTDKERFDAVKKYKISGMSINGFAIANGYNRETLREWINAYNHLEGSFIRIDNINENESIVDEKGRIDLSRKDALK